MSDRVPGVPVADTSEREFVVALKNRHARNEWAGPPECGFPAPRPRDVATARVAYTPTPCMEQGSSSLIYDAGQGARDSA